MAEKSTFFNSVNGDRKYKAEDMASHFAKMLTNGVMPAGTQLQVIENSGMNVAASAGSAWINGYAYHNDASFVLAIDPADGALNRVDRIVVRWDKLARSINLTVLKGTPASSATAPNIVRNADYYDLSIATINVDKGITAITQALITDTRMDSNVCGFVSSLIQPDTSGWFVQFESAFNVWFEGVKEALGSDAAGQLQNQINELQTQVNEIRTLSGTTPPTTSTVGVEGQFYLDTTTKTLYQCVEANAGVYSWEDKSPFEIGDILATRRTDLGEDWLLCNGDLVDQATYPILSETLGISNNKETAISTGYEQWIEDVEHHNGLWVAVGRAGYGGYYYLRVFVTQNPMRNWTMKELDKRSDYGSKLVAIDYADGMWVAVGYLKESSYPRYYTAFTTDPLNLSWTVANMGGSYAGYLEDIKGYNGTWVAVGEDDGTPVMWTTTTNNLGATWNQIFPGWANATQLYAIECVNGLWVAVGYGEDYYPWIFTTINPTGSWAGRQISFTDPVILYDIGYHDGLWVICGKHKTSNKPYIYTVTDPVNGVWIGHEIDTIECDLKCISCDENGNWVAAGKTAASGGRIYTTKDPAGNWMGASVDKSPTGVVIDDNKYVAVAYNTTGYLYAYSNGFSELPKIAVDESYAYIRGK